MHSYRWESPFLFLRRNMDIMEDDITVYEFQHGRRTLVFNCGIMSHKCQSRFLQTYQIAVKNNIDPIKFVKTWNLYAKDISEHVFWSIKEPQESQKTFIERGK